MNIRLESRDVARLDIFNINRCKKCQNKFREGDIVTRVGARPSKYYHKECFKQY
jgi:hypothetical protein